MIKKLTKNMLKKNQFADFVKKRQCKDFVK